MGESVWAVTGAAGMLGRELTGLLENRGLQVRAFDRSALDIRDPYACDKALRDSDVVVNCAAYTAVDDAESNEAAAFTVNAVGAANVARAAAKHGARLVHISTDYVFSGAGSNPIEEDAPLAPSSAYGRTKGAGEWAARALAPDALIVRTAWLYGEYGHCFPKTMARLLRERGTVAVVSDQHGQPTWASDAAGLVVRLIESGAPGGMYHATSQGDASWFEFARAVAEHLGLPAESVTPTTTEEFPRPALRPANSVLAHGALRRIGVEPIGAWQNRFAVAASAVLGGA